MVYTCFECGTSRTLPAPRSGNASIDDSSTETAATVAAPPSSSSGVEISTIDVDPSASGSGSNDRRLREENQQTGGGDKLTLEGSAEDLIEDATKQKEGVSRRPRKKKKVVARVPPLFARRDAGHVVYRGGEVVDMEGVYCV